MGDIWKNDKQVEFCTLLQTLKDAGRNQTDVAALLGISTAAVSQIVKGKTTPRATTLAVMRHIVSEVTGKPVGERAPEPINDPTQEKLNNLRREDPKAYAHLMESLEMLHDRVLIRKASESVKKESRVSYGKSKKPKHESPGNISSKADEKSAVKKMEDEIVHAVEEELKAPRTQK